METIVIHEEISLYYIEVQNFPNDIGATFSKFFSIFETFEKRRMYGISWTENGKFCYVVAAEEKVKNELSKHQLSKILIKNGEYRCIRIKNYIDDITQIAAAFDKLKSTPNLDYNGNCIEWYVEEDEVICMVKLDT